jgi:imidazolonepropionase
MIEADLIVEHASPLVTGGPGTGVKTGADLLDLGEIADGAFAAADGVIVWVGASGDVDRSVNLRFGGERVDARGRLVTPGFVDPHTHFLHAGSRENEFAMRLAGKTYQEIAAAGGGIRSSVRATRAASSEELARLLERRLDRALADGTTTVEVKVSYGLDVEQDLRGLEVVRDVAARHPVRVVATWMGAHEFPDEYRERRDDYVDMLVAAAPRVADQGIADFCDIFCEDGVFTPDQSRRILTAAGEAGLGLKIHADEFGPSGGSDVAIELGATSADHLHGMPVANLERMREAGVVPVLLPGTAFFLRMTQHAPARAMIDAGLPIALATDCNPGSCTTESMPLIVTLACLQFGLQPAEAFAAATVNAAGALELQDRIGRLARGYAADFQILEAPNVQYIAYHFGRSHVREVWVGGKRGVGRGGSRS